jgi:hypothetical protein
MGPRPTEGNEKWVRALSELEHLRVLRHLRALGFGFRLCFLFSSVAPCLCGEHYFRFLSAPGEDLWLQLAALCLCGGFSTIGAFPPNCVFGRQTRIVA